MVYCRCNYSPTHTELTVSEFKSFGRSFIIHFEYLEGGYINYDIRHIPECWHCYRKRLNQRNFETPLIDKSLDNEDTRELFLDRSIQKRFENREDGCAIQ